MKRLLATIGVGCLLGLTVSAPPASAATAGTQSAAPTPAAISCSVFSNSTATGGYRVRLDCTGIGMVFGYGTTLGDAQREATLLAQLYANTGLACSAFSVSTDTGGYRVRTDCTGIGMVFGYGSNATDAQDESRLLAQLYTDTGRACSGFSATISGGTYRVRLDCTGVGMVFGYGSSLSEAAAGARLLASIS
jgi:hypothetical protein